MRGTRSDEGFGIAEALVAILLFGIIAVALVPPIVVSLQISTRSTVVATASTVANERIELARQSASSCQDLLAFLRTAVPTTYRDSRGVAFTVVQDPSSEVAAGYAVSPAGGSGDADGDGVRDTFCHADPVDAVDFAVSVTSQAGAGSDAASAATIIAVPGLGG